jgi:tetratricopeptide (TPR) repeat protein
MLERGGRRGSVEHELAAALVSAGDLELSDLMLGEPARPDAPFRPRAGLEVGESGLMYGSVELYGQDPLLGAATVSFELSAPEGGRTLLEIPPAPEAASGEGWRRVFGAFQTVMLPPGSYLARAVVREDGELLGVVEAPFRMRPLAERPRAKRGLALAAVEIAFDRLDARELLSPETIVQVLGQLPLPSGRAPSPAVARALADVEAGRLDRLVEDLQDEQSAEAAPVFLRGLGLISLGQVRPAIEQLRLAEEAGFRPAALYLGVALTAVGEHEAGATALERAPSLPLEAPIAASVQADAWLRAGRPDKAVPVLREALERWTGDAGLERRLGLALAAAGESEEAVAVLDRVLAGRPTDLGSLLVLLWFHEESGVGDVGALRARLRAYSEASEVGAPIAELWRAHLAGRVS